jgi:hypothetical protein
MSNVCMSLGSDSSLKSLIKYICIGHTEVPGLYLEYVQVSLHLWVPGPLALIQASSPSSSMYWPHWSPRSVFRVCTGLTYESQVPWLWFKPQVPHQVCIGHTQVLGLYLEYVWASLNYESLVPWLWFKPKVPHQVCIGHTEVPGLSLEYV